MKAERPGHRLKPSNDSLERATVPRSRLAIALAAMLLVAVEHVLASTVWKGTLWGSHFLAFWPHPAWLIALPAFVLALPLRLPAGPEPGPARQDRMAAPWLPWVAGAFACALFWLARERHLFWGDATALEVNVPAGQAFHVDEPLTLFLHQVLYHLSGRPGSAADAIAFGSVLAGGLFAGWLFHWMSRRVRDRRLWPLAALVVLLQGFTQLFYGHVENYTYLALALLIFFTTGLDALEGRGHPVVPLLAAAFAFALHILGALTLVPALVLVVHGLKTPAQHKRTAAALAIVVSAVAIAAFAAAPLYDGDNPFHRVWGGVFKILANPTDTRADHLLTARRATDVWSVLALLGPLAAPLVVALILALPTGLRGGAPPALFLGTGAAAYLVPTVLAGEGNLGAARNWDLWAAPGLATALLGSLWIADRIDARQARRLLVALVALSALHTIPWVALNASLERTERRVATLPLGRARGETMLGTHYLNRGELPQAERWFRAAVARDPGNPNAQSGLGLALARQNRLEEARAPMEAAVGLKPYEVSYRNDVIALLVRQRQWAPAGDHLEALLAIQPKNADAWLMLAQCLTELGRPDIAARALSTGLQVVPDDPRIRATLEALSRRGVQRHG
jgi:Tfp pilus assembly protein PilF